MGGIVLRQNEGEEVAMTPSRSVLIKADLEQLTVTESWFGSRQNGAAPHIHKRHADSFYVLEGELTFLTADGDLAAPAGATFLAPSGVMHGFDHDRDGEVRYLNFHTPARGFAQSLRARRDPKTYDPVDYDSFDPHEDAPTGAVLLQPGEGERYEADTRVATIKIGREELSLIEFELEPGFQGPEPHTHDDHVDSFYVVEGEAEFQLDNETLRLSAGSFVAAPPGVVHTFSNPGSGRTRLLNIHAPSSNFHEIFRAREVD
jgi:quercetin dioxygenase-like cupin family protein